MKKQYICLYYNVDGSEISTQYPTSGKKTMELARYMASCVPENNSLAYAFSTCTYKEVKTDSGKEYVKIEDSGIRYINGTILTREEILNEGKGHPFDRDQILDLMEQAATDKAVQIDGTALVYPFIEGWDKVIKIKKTDTGKFVEGKDV